LKQSVEQHREAKPVNQLANVVIVKSRCCQNKESFAIRFEEKVQGQWYADWAFPVQETVSKKEGYDKNEIRGDIMLDSAYPDCPHCNNGSIILCSQCDKVSCHDSTSHLSLCAWCNISASVGGSIQGLKAGQDY